MLEAFVNGFRAGSIQQFRVIKDGCFYGFDSSVTKDSKERMQNLIDCYLIGEKSLICNKIFCVSGVLIGEIMFFPINLPMQISSDIINYLYRN